jgi:sulfofructose kinase
MTQDARVVCIGIATVDAIVVVDRLPGSDERVPGLDGRLAGGGVAATAAVTLARLGIPVAFVGRVGDDAAGRWIRDGLAAEDVAVDGLRLDPERGSPVSSALIERATGARSLAPFLGDGGPIELRDADLRAARQAEWIHVDDLGLATLPALARAGIATSISVDDGVGQSQIPWDAVALYAPTAEVLQARFPAPSLEASAEACLAAGPRLVAATRGADGSLISERSREGGPIHAAVPAWPVQVVSTLGAGDVFHGALLAGLVEGLPPVVAAQRAGAAAAMSCAALDGRSGIPTRSQLELWLAAQDGTSD